MDWRKIARWALLILSVFLMASSGASPQEAGLIRAFDQTGAKADRYMFHVGSRTLRNYAAEDIHHLARGLADDLGLGELKTKSMTDGTRHEAQGEWNRNIHVKMTVINDRPRDLFVQPYISIRATGRGPLSSTRLLDTRNRLSQTLQKFRIQTRTHFSIQGRLPYWDSMAGGHREDVVNRVIRELGATEVESMRTKRTTSVSAHTPLFNGGLNTKGGTMNVQVAAKVGDDDRQIILTLGTPIITIEY